MHIDGQIVQMMASPLAITDETLATIQAIIERKLSDSPEPSAEALDQAAALRGARRQVAPRVGDIAVLTLHGVIMPRASMIAQSSGVMSLATFRQDLRAALDDKAVGSILVNVNSPGGSVDHVSETAEELFKARSVKPIVAIADAEAASAAYWIAANASEFVVTPSGRVGSIGVMTAHKDESERLENEGVRFQIIRAGRYKNEGAGGALDDEALAYRQSVVDEYYGQFIDAVARGRGVASSTVRNGFGQGRVVTAKAARSEGMVDRVATFEDTLGRMQKRGGRITGASRATASARDFHF